MVGALRKLGFKRVFDTSKVGIIAVVQEAKW
jgi:iron only hydrogenase large subunit-like protein